MSRTGDLYLQAIIDSEDSAEWAKEQRDRVEGPENELESQDLEEYQDIIWWEN